MTAIDLPTIANYSNSSSSYQLGMVGNAAAGLGQMVYGTPVQKDWNLNAVEEIAKKVKQFQHEQKYEELKQAKEKPMAEKTGKRIVQVFIVDPNDNVPLESALLHKGEQKFTDATDQELFFEVEITRLLEVHNQKRAEILDKKATKASGKEVFLEPAKIRDLKMVISTLAEF